MRFLHAADLHLDSPFRSVAMRAPDLADRLKTASRGVLRRIVDVAIERQVDALLLAGDVFDNGVPDVAARTVLARALTRLGEAGIPTVLIRGNHDGLLDPARYGALGENIIMLDHERPTVEIGDAAIHGLSHVGRVETRSFLPRYPHPAQGRINIGLMHCSPDGAPGHDPYAPCAVTDLHDHGYDYWALGHIHARQEWRRDHALAVMAGIPQGRHIREGQGGSVTLIEIDGLGARAEEIPVETVAFREIDLSLPADEAQDARLRRVREQLGEATAGGEATVLRVTLRGPGTQPFSAKGGDARAFLATLAEDVEGLHLDRVLVAPDEAQPPTAVVGELAALMQEETTKPGFEDEAGRILAELRDALPTEVRDALGPDELDNLIQAGLGAVTARLSMRDEA